MSDVPVIVTDRSRRRKRPPKTRPPVELKARVVEHAPHRGAPWRLGDPEADERVAAFLARMGLIGVLVVACTRCEREGRYSLDSLIAIRGRRCGVPELPSCRDTPVSTGLGCGGGEGGWHATSTQQQTLTPILPTKTTMPKLMRRRGGEVRQPSLGKASYVFETKTIRKPFSGVAHEKRLAD
jgi:hypothetical protein